MRGRSYTYPYGVGDMLSAQVFMPILYKQQGEFTKKAFKKERNRAKQATVRKIISRKQGEVETE